MPGGCNPSDEHGVATMEVNMLRSIIPAIAGLSTIKLMLGTSAFVVASTSIAPEASARPDICKDIPVGSSRTCRSVDKCNSDGSRYKIGDTWHDTPRGWICDASVLAPTDEFAVTAIKAHNIGNRVIAGTQVTTINCPPNTIAQPNGTCLANRNFTLQRAPVSAQALRRTK